MALPAAETLRRLGFGERRQRELVTPMSKRCWFVRDRDYSAYDTLACVGNLKKAMNAGDMMSEEEILKLQQNTQQVNMEGVNKPSKRWLRRRWKERRK